MVDPELLQDLEKAVAEEKGAVAQALLGFGSEPRWLRYANAHLTSMFPRLPQQVRVQQAVAGSVTVKAAHSGNFATGLPVLTLGCVPGQDSEIWLSSSRALSAVNPGVTRSRRRGLPTGRLYWPAARPG